MARYCDAKDLRALVPDLYRDAALADSAGGTEADAGLLAAVLESACNEVDALVEGRVRLPLATVPRKLRVAAAYIALELLSIRRGLNLREDAAAKVQWWRTWLSKVGEGELRLDAPAPDAAGAFSGHSSSVAVRPSVTGTHGLMFGLLLAFPLFALVPAETSRAVEARTWAFDLPEAADVFDNPAEMEWAAGESLVLSYAGGALSAGQTARWEVASGTNLWLALGPDAAGSPWTWSLAPTQTCLPSGRYAGRIAVYETDGESVSFQRVAALQSIRVHQGTGGFAQVAPVAVVLTNYATLAWIATNYLPATPSRRSARDKTGNPVFIPFYDVSHDVQFGRIGLDGDFIESWADFRGQLRGPNWLTPARFSWTATVATTVTTNVGPETDGHYAVLTRAREVVTEKEYVLDPSIERNQWDEPLRVSVEGPASIAPVGDGTYLLSWDECTPTGTTAKVSGQLGEWRDSATVTLTERGNILTQQWFSSFAPGGVRERLAGVLTTWTNMSGDVYRFTDFSVGKTSTVETLALTPNTNFWARDCDLSGVSVWNDNGGYYYTQPATLVASNLCYGAAHWSIAIGKTLAWYGKDGRIHSAKIVDQRRMTGDLCVSKIHPPLDTNAVTAYPILDLDAIQGKINAGDGRVYGLPIMPVLAMSQAERAWIMQSALSSGVEGIFDSAAGAYIRNSRNCAVGGDSGHPTFVSTDATNLVLLGCYWTPNGLSVPGEQLNKPLVSAAAEAMGADPDAIRWEGWTNWPTYLGPLSM